MLTLSNGQSLFDGLNSALQFPHLVIVSYRVPGSIASDVANLVALSVAQSRSRAASQ
ncbi:MAG TPA: hypothetical protein VHG29_08425 [Novosphingobium sp.]|nr:hypothetical protein [Novosphingobium sp.]